MITPVSPKTARLAMLLVGLSLLGQPPVDAASPPQVVVETAQRTEIVEVVTLDGTVRSLHEAELSVQIGGLVDGVFVDAGDQVVAGTPLLELDSELERLALDELEAQRREATAARREAARRLREARSVGAGRHIAETEVQARAASLAQADARESRLNAAVARGEARVAKLRVDAPFDGVIVTRQAERGEWVDPGDPLFVLVDLDVIRLDFPVPQRFHGLLGDEAELAYRPDDGSAAGWSEARIATVVPVTDSTDRTFLVRGEPEVNQTLLPGMAVEGRLRLPTGRHGLTVARDAVQRYPDGRTTVWIVTGDGDTVAERSVTLSGGFDERVIVTRGIEPGAAVVVKGNEALSEGMTVRPTDEETH
ncbi:efflux RND transporter periplasmic adaptor subunit [Guyparkeria hydrothermalis]|uniref:efflux RND transporter periplasmic adaptor subunit n=1 Tax=Guyparkeria hydrothermalis TaxID=923 RepID=UPI00201FF21E|nr:efflux RND transporter periplasmic adaptor subunit [Guyparkeria hydrothermalis]MCL7743958.1 efflux RND transporter periplasmic adaptor subunit [Guyparkeria hydrothermalis]